MHLCAARGARQPLRGAAGASVRPGSSAGGDTGIGSARPRHERRAEHGVIPPREACREGRGCDDLGSRQSVASPASAGGACAAHARGERVERGPPHPIATPCAVMDTRSGASADALAVASRRSRRRRRRWWSRDDGIWPGSLLPPSAWVSRRGGRFAARPAARQGKANEASASGAATRQAIREVRVPGSAAGSWWRHRLRVDATRPPLQVGSFGGPSSRWRHRPVSLRHSLSKRGCAFFAPL